MVTDEYKVQSRPSWFDELPDWWERAENERKAASSRLETELSHQITTMQYQTQALARVTNHLAQEVARLRPEYWQPDILVSIEWASQISIDNVFQAEQAPSSDVDGHTCWIGAADASC